MSCCALSPQAVFWFGCPLIAPHSLSPPPAWDAGSGGTVTPLQDPKSPELFGCLQTQKRRDGAGGKAEPWGLQGSG